MRIIAGEYRSRKLHSPPPGAMTRPMPDRVRESLFSLLRGNIEGAAVLDAFAGTGVIGLEALSRGASRCVFIERDRRVADVLRKNIAMLGCEDRAEVVAGDALGLSALARCPRPVDLIFFDPPYPMVLDAKPGGGWERCRGQFGRLVDLLSDTGFAVLRTPWPFFHPDDPNVSLSAPEEEPEEHGRRRSGKGRRAGMARSARQGDDARWTDPAGKGKLRTTGARHRDEEGDEMEELDLEELEELGELEGGDEAHDADEAPHGPGETIARHEVDLHLPNAVGPETHVYRHSAVHLFMRRREGASAQEGAAPSA